MFLSYSPVVPIGSGQPDDQVSTCDRVRETHELQSKIIVRGIMKHGFSLPRDLFLRRNSFSEFPQFEMESNFLIKRRKSRLERENVYVLLSGNRYRTAESEEAAARLASETDTFEL